MEQVTIPIRWCETSQEANAAAQEAANASIGRAVPGIFYQQGDRRFISAALPTRILLSIARRDSATKQGDPSKNRNRPLDNKHVNEIATYLATRSDYLIPPITLNASKPLQIFAMQTQTGIHPCTFVLPDNEFLYVTDGQHRLEAVRQSVDQGVGLDSDGIGVTVIEEANLDKVHQDFFDAAQVKPLQRSLLVEYDGQEPLNLLTKDVRDSAAIFKGRVELIGNVGKNSLMLFTTHQIKQALLNFVVGDWSLFSGALYKQATPTVSAGQELWKDRAVNVLNEFAAHNTEWSSIIESPVDSGPKIPDLRARFLHFTTAGLLVICGVAHTIRDTGAQRNGQLSDTQKDLIHQLAAVDWRRSSPLWAGYLVDSRGVVANLRGNIVLAIARVKRELNLPLMEKEEKAILAFEKPAESAQEKSSEDN